MWPWFEWSARHQAWYYAIHLNQVCWRGKHLTQTWGNIARGSSCSGLWHPQRSLSNPPPKKSIKVLRAPSCPTSPSVFPTYRRYLGRPNPVIKSTRYNFFNYTREGRLWSIKPCSDVTPPIWCDAPQERQASQYVCSLRCRCVYVHACVCVSLIICHQLISDSCHHYMKILQRTQEEMLSASHCTV